MSLLKNYKNKFFITFVLDAILPTTLILASKIISMLLFASLYDLSYTVGNKGILFNDFNNFVLVNDYSNIFTYLVVFSFVIWLLFKAYFLHASHIKPSWASYLHLNDLGHLISRNFNIYIKLPVWIIFTWLITFVFLIHLTLNLTSSWVFYLALFLSTVATVFTIVDLEKEHNLLKLK